ncbi:holin [Corynebacterium sp.]|uniref:holin n=1 Tax=Corynebacterium sp. TaxID=1720 RepID=UPI0028A92021|nr:holin [Corynebacterium sp.]
MLSKTFLKDAAERAIGTFAQSLLATFGVGTPIWGLDWETSLGISATAALISVLKSVAASTVGNPESASLVKVEPEK